MIVYARTPPPGDFERFGFPVTLGEVALVLFQDRELCLAGCSKSDTTMLQLVSEPYGYDMTFVAAMPACSTGDVYFTRKTAAMVAVPFAPAINRSTIPQTAFRRMS
jgi:hypothetical protein